MLIVAICEDEIYMLEELKTRIKSYMDCHKISAQIFTFTSGEKFLKEIFSFDIVFMDMKLTGMNGMEAIEQLRRQGKNSQVIFITSYKKYVFQAFDVNAVHYLIKPVSDYDLFHAIDKAVENLQSTDKQTITVMKGTMMQIISIRDILYCESIGHKIIIHTISDTIEYFGTLENLQTRLNDCFFRCHRSYIVHMNYIIAKEKDTVFLTNGEKIFISRRKQQEFTQKLLTFFQNEVL